MSIRRHRRRRRWRRLQESSAPVVRVLVLVVVVVVAAMVGFTLMRHPMPANGNPHASRYTPLPTVTESAELHVGYLDMALLKLGVV